MASCEPCNRQEDSNQESNADKTNWRETLFSIKAALDRGETKERKVEHLQVIKQAVVETPPHIQEVLDADLLPFVIDMLKNGENESQQVMAAWIITNIVSGETEQTEQAVEAGIIPPLVEVLQQATTEELIYQIIWAFGNIAGESTCCSQIVTPSIVSLICSHCTRPTVMQSLESLRNVSWALSNFCRTKPSREIVEMILPRLVDILAHSLDTEVLQNVCWALVHITKRAENIRIVFNANVHPHLMRILNRTEQRLVSTALKVLGQFTLEDNDVVNALIDADLMVHLKRLLELYPSNILHKELCWILSNIAAGPDEHKQLILDMEFLPLLPSVIKSVGSKLDILVDVAYILGNLIFTSPTIMKQLLEQGLINMYLELLSITPAKRNPNHADVVYGAIQSIISNSEFCNLGVKETLMEQATRLGEKSIISNLTEIIRQVDPTCDDTDALVEQLANISLKEEPKTKGKPKSTAKNAKSQTIQKRYNTRSSKNAK